MFMQVEVGFSHPGPLQCVRPHVNTLVPIRMGLCNFHRPDPWRVEGGVSRACRHHLDWAHWLPVFHSRVPEKQFVCNLIEV